MTNNISESFYNEFERTFKEKFSSRFNDFEQQRKKENLLYKVKSFLLFIVIPIIIYFIIARINVVAVFSALFLLSIFVFPLFTKKFILQAVPLASLFIVAFLVYFKLDFLAVIFYTGLYIFVDIICFLNFRTRCNRKFMSKIKAQNTSEIIESISNLKWVGNDYVKAKNSKVIPNAIINNSNLFLSYNIRHIDDEFQGIYNDVPFEISETILYNLSTSRNTETKNRIFQGVILKFKTNKNAKAGTIVSTKRNFTQQNEFWFTLLGFAALGIFAIYSLIIGWKDPTFPIACKIFFPIFIVLIPFIMFKAYKNQKEKFKKINLEDAEFEKIFNVYSSDQIEARYLLTTAFMERFKNIQTSFGAKIIKCSFFEDNLIIAITTDKNLFEIGSLFDSFNDPKIIKQFFNELGAIYKMVEYFKLDEKTGL